MEIFNKIHRQKLYRIETPIKILILPDIDPDSVSSKVSMKIDESCAITKIIYFGSLLKFLPFKWNFDSNKMEAASARDQMLVNVNLSWIFSYVGLKVYFLILSKSTNPVSYSITGSLFFVMFVLALLLHLNNIYNMDNIVCTVNTYCSRIRKYLGEIFMLKRTVCMLEMFWTLYISLIHALIFVAIPIFMKTNSISLFLLLDLYCLYSFLVIVGFYVFLIVDCAAVVEKLSKNMTIRIHGVSHIWLSTKRVEELKSLQRDCNELQIGFSCYQSIMEPLVLPLFLAIATIFSTLGLFTVIKFFGELGIFISMVLSLGESLCISVTSLGLCKASSICDNNQQLQKQLCHLQLFPKKSKHELKVIMKCIRPIRFKIGTFFPVSRQTATDFLESLCSWLTTLLLTYG